jgi:hypothetical protein
MRTFVRHKSVEEIAEQCEAAGVQLDRSSFERGGDYIYLTSPGVTVGFNTFNGRFFGKTPEGVQFSSDDRRDGIKWFDALLDFFYSEQPRVQA